MAERRRQRTLNIRVSEEEFQMMQEVAENEGETVSNWIRQAFRKAHKRLFGAQSPKKK